MSPLVSVIMPAYNCVHTVEQSVCSIIDQTMSDFELIIIDDGSSDQTFDLLMRLKQRDPRITVLRNDRNIGVAATRNRAIDMANGKYIAFLDSDDIWKSDKLEKQIALLNKENGDLCFTSYEFFDVSGMPISQTPYIAPKKTNYYNMLRENEIGLSTVLIRRDALQGVRFEKQWFHEDYVLWLTLLRMGKTAWGLQEVLVTYRLGGRSSNKFKAAKNRWRIYRSYEKLSFVTSLYFFCYYIYNGIKKFQAKKRI
jgi:teichuronic acid biosynthesis glycosyltransferase TuaG